MKESLLKHLGMSFAGVIGLMIAVVVGVFIGAAIPHEVSGRLDSFRDTVASVIVFLAGLGLRVGFRMQLRELWSSLALLQIPIFLIVGYYTAYSSIFGWWFLYVSKHVTMPFFLSLILLFGLSFATRRTKEPQSADKER
jgi:hypothetical protein